MAKLRSRLIIIYTITHALTFPDIIRLSNRFVREKEMTITKASKTYVSILYFFSENITLLFKFI